MKPEERGFVNRMSPLQTALGWLYVPLHIVLLPLLLNIYVAWRAPDTSPVTVNLAYLAIGIVFTLTVMLPFLRASFDAFLDRAGVCLHTMLLGFCANYVLSTFVSLLFLLFDRQETNPNDAYVLEMAASERGPVLAMNIFLAPLVEELLFRGVIFGSLRPRSAPLAYGLSALLFALAHVWQYAAAQGDPLVLLFALRYVPVSLVLAWCYDHSGSIWTPVFFHMAFNGISFAVLG